MTQPIPTMFEQIQTHHPAIVWLRFAVRMGLFAAALLWSAGRWLWWEAWVTVGLWAVFGVVTTRYLLRHDPALLAERLKLVPVSRDQKPWDRVIMALFFVAGVALYIVPGLDVVRYGWSEPLPLWVRIAALLVQVPCLAGLNWIVRENTWLAQVVKIDEARHQQVITTGPYALVRHPMYTITIVLVFAIPAALGSRYALLLSLFLTALLIVRTWLEDRTLHAELEGYSDYARQTRYRLIPGIW